MEEIIVSFENAVKASKHGYAQEPTKLSQPYYNYKGELNGSVIDYIKHRFTCRDKGMDPNTPSIYDSIRAMTQAQLHKWFIEKHKLFIEVTPEAFTDGYNWNVRIIDLDFDNSLTFYWKEFGERTSGLFGESFNHQFETYEDALEFGFEKAFEKI